MNEKLLICAAVVILVAVVYTVSSPARVVTGETAIPTSNSLDLVAKKGQADASVTLTVEHTDYVFDILNGQLSEPPKQAEARKVAGIRIKQTDYRPLIAPAYNFPFDDFGAIYAAGSKRGTFAGLRVSPARCLYGFAAPDILIGAHEFGAGVSIYAPGGLLGSWSRHCGVGVGHSWATDSGDSANIFYLAFSTHN